MTFVPDLLPPDISYEPIMRLMDEARGQLGTLEGMGRIMQNPSLLIRPYLTKEAVYSSRIEGTMASVMDVFRFDLEHGSNERAVKSRVREVHNYSKALQNCLARIDGGEAVSLDMIRYAHSMLLDHAPGHDKKPGMVRDEQNWIGSERVHASIRNAVYVPPAEHLLDHMLSNLIQFVSNPPPNMPVLVLCAVAHYQFESIHPFRDGNGRIGRLLMPLILAERRTLSKPLLFLSFYIEENKLEYYDCLQAVRQYSKWTEWLEFFMKGVIQCSKEAINATDRMLELKSEYERSLRESRSPRSAVILVGKLFSSPVVTIPAAADYLKMTYASARNAVAHLEDAGILKAIDARKRGKLYVARDILDVFS
jgi:Fic family protein